jgi:uncharacterized membrane protein YbhN (UPF0104 family)
MRRVPPPGEHDSSNREKYTDTAQRSIGEGHLGVGLLVDMAKKSQRNIVIRRVAAVVVTGLTFYIVFPALLRVISAWPHLSSLAPAWLAVMVVTETVSFFCSLALQRLVLRIKGWFAIITAGLTGNAVTNVLPGGDAVGASVQFQMLVTSGIDSVQAAGGLATSSLLGVAGLFSLPILCCPPFSAAYRSTPACSSPESWASEVSSSSWPPAPSC